jgi:hypothetical protein
MKKPKTTPCTVADDSEINGLIGGRRAYADFTKSV